MTNGEGDSLYDEEKDIQEDELAGRLADILEYSDYPLMVVLDEGHNSKNPKTCRSKAVRRIASISGYFYPMSGNIFPDNLDDLGEVASLLDPNFENPFNT